MLTFNLVRPQGRRKSPTDPISSNALKDFNNSASPEDQNHCQSGQQGHEDQDQLVQQDFSLTGTEDEEDEEDAALLSTQDYHHFLSSTSTQNPQLPRSITRNTYNTRISSVDATTTYSGSDLDLASRSPSSTRTVIRTNIGRGTQSPPQTLRTRQSLPLRERRAQALAEQFANAGKSQIPVPSLHSLKSKQSMSLRERRYLALSQHFPVFESPKTSPAQKTPALKESLTSPSPSNHFTALRGRSASQPALHPYPGPAGTISSRDISPSKLQPFIGPLTAPQPPPTRPLPLPPSRSRGCSSRFIMPTGSEKQTKNGESSDVSQRLPSRSHPTSTSPSKQRMFSMTSRASTANNMEDKSEDKRQEPKSRLRKQVSKFFGEDPAPRGRANNNANVSAPTPVSTYRPISLLSHDHEGLSLSGIFDDVYKAARGGSYDHATGTQSSGITPVKIEGPPTFVQLREAPAGSAIGAQNIAGTARKPGTSSASGPSQELVLSRMPTRGDKTSESLRGDLAFVAAVNKLTPPPIHEHPAIRDDQLDLDARLTFMSMTANKAGANTLVVAPTSNPTPLSQARVPPLNVSGQPPVEIAVPPRDPAYKPLKSAAEVQERANWYTRRVKKVSPPKQDIDDVATLDRTSDVTWYRMTSKEGDTQRVGEIPHPMNMFSYVSTTYMCRYGRGKENYAYINKKRFRYFDLKPYLRFMIIEKLLEDVLPGKPILLNNKRAAAGAWPDDAFATLWDVLGPLQNCLKACPRLRSEIMATIFLTQPFHVIFSPFVKPQTQPLATKWFFKYCRYMNFISVEMDMTKLGFGATWEATTMSTKLWDIGNLVYCFVDETLARSADEYAIGQLTIYCRRYFGYRQGKNPYEGDKNAYKKPLIGGDSDDESAAPKEGLPLNHGAQSTDYPPSCHHPYSGHRRHHTYTPDRVPYVHDGHMSIADPFKKLAGRVWSVRMVGLGEKWVRENHVYFWTKEEFDSIEDHGLYVDRHTPSKYAYVPPGGAVFFDYGVHVGIHRFPPLPDSEHLICVDYDPTNDLFVEVGTGNILSVDKNGVEIIDRAENPPVPLTDLPLVGAGPIPLTFLSSAVRHSRIPTPVGGAMTPKMQVMRSGTPSTVTKRVASGSTVVNSSAYISEQEGDDDEGQLTPTKSRATSFVGSRWASQRQQDDMCSISQQQSRSSSVAAHRVGKLSTKKSFMGLMADRRKASK